jgi:uncharacterized protein
MFLVDDDVNELDYIRFNMLRARYGSNSFGLTIAPTSDCNFRCVYCYEQDVIRPGYMGDGVQDALCEWLRSRVKYIDSFSVTWYGGEPLLALDAIKRMSEKFIKICDENDVSYGAGMITNGYLLSVKTLKALRKMRVSFLQVTLDGGAERHNANRPLANGSGTFDKILLNLKRGAEHLPRVSLRINIDKDNMTAGEDAVRFLAENGLSEKVFPYYGRVTNDNGNYTEEKCLNACDFAGAEYDFALEAAQNRRGIVRYPNSKTAFCGADCVNSFVVGADGELYKCWSDIGRAGKSVGNITRGANPPTKALLDYMLFDPTAEPQCSACGVLPICMGGCPFQRRRGGQSQCVSHKYILEKCLLNAAKTLKTSCAPLE